MNLKQEQQVQDDFYNFPYHYAVEYKGNFSMFFLNDWGLNYASASEFILDKIKESGTYESILDIGCGDGKLTREIALEFRNSTVAGVDYSPKPILLAKALNQHLNIDFYAMNIIDEKLPEQYSSATLMEVYEHIEPSNAEAFLQGVHSSLKADGILHLTVPHENIPIGAHHFRHFNVKILSSELEKYFDILEVVPFERISKKRKWIQRLFANKYFILNNKKWRNKIYAYYKKHLFFTSNEKEAQRIYIKCKKK